MLTRPEGSRQIPETARPGQDHSKQDRFSKPRHLLADKNKFENNVSLQSTLTTCTKLPTMSVSSLFITAKSLKKQEHIIQNIFFS